MHNRARLVVASFLTKDLGIDWRRGERWFMRLLMDGDQANNNGNWQWIASVGVDPQPFFRRPLQPGAPQERYDPDGEYVRRHVRGAAEVPHEYLAEPWEPEERPAEVDTRSRSWTSAGPPRGDERYGLSRNRAAANQATRAASRFTHACPSR